MPKLLQVNSMVNMGSTGRIAEGLGQHVMNKGWESYIAFGRESRDSKSKLIKIGHSKSHITNGLQSRLFDNHGLNAKGATQKFLKEINQLKPDVIHLHNIHGYYLNYPILFEYLKASEIPVVWTFHDCWPFTGHCSYFSNISCTKWQTECNACPKSKNYPSSLFLDKSTRNFYKKKEVFNSLDQLTIVPVSNWLNGLIKQSFLQKQKTQVIHNGINLKDFSPTVDKDYLVKKYKLQNKLILLGVATAWQKAKGLDDFKALSEKLEDDQVIILVGLTKEQVQDLPPKIIGVERTESVEELAKYYSCADILLNLSYQETFGMTTVEAYACGTPAIVYNATASPELVTKETGIIIEPGNMNELLDAIKTIQSKGKNHYSQHCLERAQNHFDTQSRYDDYFDVYQQMLN